MKKHRFLLLALGVFALALNVRAGDFADRKAQAVADSGKPVAVRGATSITVAAYFASTFDLVVKTFAKADDPVVVADREAGLIATEIAITGGWHQTGTRTVVTFIKDSPTVTIVKVAVTTQKRYKALQVEPWDDPVLDKALTKAAADNLRAVLGGK